ncbi:MAG: chorismate synthase [Limnochordia bacterium]|jgi:chorismate synthase
MLRYLDAGESHGQALVAIVEGMPAGVPLKAEAIDAQLARRQQGHGRGGRMEIERDRVEILSGVRYGYTLGSPIACAIFNRDWANWQEKMAVEPGLEAEPVTRPRPGHADLAGVWKYKQTDIRNILERASARQTAIRTAVGSVARCLLDSLGIEIYSHVVAIGSVEAPPASLEMIKNMDSPVSCAHPQASQQMVEAIDAARREGDTLGGIFEVIICGVPPGIGSHVHWDRRLDGRLAGAFMSIQAIKGVEIGLGFQGTRRPGSQVHDPITYDGAFRRPTNHAGGIEGGISNGEAIVIRCGMKPIPTLYKPLPSVDLVTKEPVEAVIERSDACAVPAAAVVGEAVGAWVIAQGILEKFGGDSLEELKDNYDRYLQEVDR